MTIDLMRALAEWAAHDPSTTPQAAVLRARLNEWRSTTPSGVRAEAREMKAAASGIFADAVGKLTGRKRAAAKPAKRRK